MFCSYCDEGAVHHELDVSESRGRTDTQNRPGRYDDESSGDSQDGQHGLHVKEKHVGSRATLIGRMQWQKQT